MFQLKRDRKLGAPTVGLLMDVRQDAYEELIQSDPMISNEAIISVPAGDAWFSVAPSVRPEGEIATRP